MERWAARWWSSTAKLRTVTEDLSPLPNLSSNNRRWSRVLSRLRIGHTKLTHGYLLTGGGEPPTCENCQSEPQITIKHILTECPAHLHARRRIFKRDHVSLAYLLKECDTSPTGPLAQFLTSTGIINLI